MFAIFKTWSWSSPRTTFFWSTNDERVKKYPSFYIIRLLCSTYLRSLLRRRTAGWHWAPARTEISNSKTHSTPFVVSFRIESDFQNFRLFEILTCGETSEKNMKFPKFGLDPFYHGINQFHTISSRTGPKTVFFSKSLNFSEVFTNIETGEKHFPTSYTISWIASRGTFLHRPVLHPIYLLGHASSKSFIKRSFYTFWSVLERDIRITPITTSTAQVFQVLHNFTGQ